MQRVGQSAFERAEELARRPLARAFVSAQPHQVADAPRHHQVQRDRPLQLVRTNRAAAARSAAVLSVWNNSSISQRARYQSDELDRLFGRLDQPVGQQPPLRGLDARGRIDFARQHHAGGPCPSCRRAVRCAARAAAGAPFDVPAPWRAARSNSSAQHRGILRRCAQLARSLAQRAVVRADQPVRPDAPDRAPCTPGSTMSPPRGRPRTPARLRSVGLLSHTRS